MRSIKVRWMAFPLLVLAVGCGTASAFHSRPPGAAGDSASPKNHTGANALPVRGVIPVVPTCPPITGSQPTTISISTGPGGSFAQSCYYAAAGQQLVINFTNSVVAQVSKAPTSLTLLISPSQDPAISSVPGNPMFGTIDESKAVFVGSPVVAPQTGIMSVPPLSAGTYVLQALEMPMNFMATLVVQ